MDWAVAPFRDYRDFAGRSPRKPFWLFHLAFTVVSVAASAVDMALGMETLILDVIGPLSLATLVILLSPSLALMARRLHDSDRSGWWLLLGLAAVPAMPLIARGVPLAGVLLLPALMLLSLFALPGTRGPNRYGDDPRPVRATAPV